MRTRRNDQTGCKRVGRTGCVNEVISSRTKHGTHTIWIFEQSNARARGSNAQSRHAPELQEKGRGESFGPDFCQNKEEPFVVSVRIPVSPLCLDSEADLAEAERLRAAEKLKLKSQRSK